MERSPRVVGAREPPRQGDCGGLPRDTDLRRRLASGATSRSRGGPGGRSRASPPKWARGRGKLPHRGKWNISCLGGGAEDPADGERGHDRRLRIEKGQDLVRHRGTKAIWKWPAVGERWRREGCEESRERDRWRGLRRKRRVVRAKMFVASFTNIYALLNTDPLLSNVPPPCKLPNATNAPVDGLTPTDTGPILLEPPGSAADYGSY